MTFTRRQTLGLLATASFLPQASRAAAPLTVTATTGMIADAARNIAGDLAEVTALMGPGVDPHGYRQTRSDIVTLSRAEMILWNGLHLEAQLIDLMEKLAPRTPVIAVAEAVPAEALVAHSTYEGRPDPHVWMAPRLWAHAVTATEKALAAARPEDAPTFAANAERYRAEIAKLDTYAREVLTSVPQEARVLVTAHDAFGYFGSDYGFEVLGIQGISTESEAGLQRIKDLVDTLVARKIQAVFVESSVSDRNIRALIEGAAAQGHEVVIGGELFSDAMGQPGSYEGTYIGMIDHNVTTISRALGGTPPSAGMNGKLAIGS
jgi:manganese/zinc/iron transport system substrate-binding protein